MTTEPEEAGDTARRKFDDVAQLFGSIVPPPGATPRPMRPFRPLPTSLPVQPSPQVVPLPRPIEAPEPAEVSPPESAPKPPASVPIPPPTPSAAPAPATVPVMAKVPATIPATPKAPASPRPRPTEIPWPDAFEPRPNFRKPQRRKLSWLLLIPAGLVAAVAVTMLDTRALRSWIDAHVLHRTSIPATLESPLLPAPFRTGATTSQTPNPAPTAPEPEPPIPYPALPTSPVPVPPGTEVSPPPIDPATAAPPAPMHVTIQFRRGIPGADGEARRLAALLQSTGGSVELRPNANTLKTPTITYYSPADHASASALALVLANEAPNWTVRLGTAPGTTKPPPGSLDVWLP